MSISLGASATQTTNNTSQLLSLIESMGVTSESVQAGLSSLLRVEEKQDPSELLDNSSVVESEITHAAISDIEPSIELTKEVVMPKGDIENYANSAHSAASDYINPNGALYLRNVPASSILTFNEDVTLLPKETVVYYNNGKRVYENPLSSGSLVETYCQLRLTHFDAGRRLPSGRSVSVNKVLEESFTETTSDYGDVNLQVVRMDLINPHLKRLVCISNDSSEPLSINDITYETGGAVDIKVRNFIDVI
ncbi:TPA: hypothetical protein I7730_14405 [Vibrio vulnificus]|uniref:Uncharacterized protein n=1 Tax=Vibrio vulnificus TaxID=672 RepID=A0A8H9N1D4_VIBVL|nr:hypothetical protein [Vibrio vulnificus]